MKPAMAKAVVGSSVPIVENASNCPSGRSATPDGTEIRNSHRRHKSFQQSGVFAMPLETFQCCIDIGLCFNHISIFALSPMSGFALVKAAAAILI